jgi:uncharacterized protein with HEPN domain
MRRTLVDLDKLVEGPKEDWDADRHRQLAATYLLITIGNAARAWEESPATSGRPFRSVIRLRDRIAHFPVPTLIDSDVIWHTAKINGQQLAESVRALLNQRP